MRSILFKWSSLLCSITLFFSTISFAETTKRIDKDEKNKSFFPTPEKWQPLKAGFSIQSDMLFSLQKDYSYKKFLRNNYLTASIRNNYLEVGARFEELLSPLPGKSPEEFGIGVPNVYIKGMYGNFAELTIGDFYEQFGNGTIFRAYEDRALGIDNSVRGARLSLSPYKGIRIKSFIGQQRYTFDRFFKLYNLNRGYITGGDLDLNFNEWIKALQKKSINLQIGASFVSKFEKKEDILLSLNNKNFKLNLPEQVAAFGGRFRLGVKGFVLNGEYSYKVNDPTAENNYIYHNGSVAMLSASYSQRGMSFLLQAKRSENFNFLSKRGITGLHLHINHLPPFTIQHTYSLAALYPYATQSLGEWAFQGEFRYKFKRKTFLGGKYGTGIRINASHVRGLKKHYLKGVNPENPKTMFGTDAYKSPFFGMGNLYYSDASIEISKKVNKYFSFSFTYLNQIYNQKVVEGHIANPKQKTPYIYSNIFIYDGLYKFNRKFTLRTELQYLQTKQADGDWLFGLAEISLFSDWMISISDQFNVGRTKEHYYMGGVTYTKGAHRVMLSYGRTSDGMNCSGGVCRWMPQTKGVYLSYNGNF